MPECCAYATKEEEMPEERGSAGKEVKVTIGLNELGDLLTTLGAKAVDMKPREWEGYMKLERQFSQLVGE
jgi:cytolysin (calcineurin-like family phosphatase)